MIMIPRTMMEFESGSNNWLSANIIRGTETANCFVERFLGDECDDWLNLKQQLNVHQDTSLVKILLNFFRNHGGLECFWNEQKEKSEHHSTTSNVNINKIVLKQEESSQNNVVLKNRDSSSSDEAVDCMKQDTKRDEYTAEDSANPATGTVKLSAGIASKTSRLPARHHTRSPSVSSPTACSKTYDLPAVAPELMCYFSCGICGADKFADLSAHLAHLWSAHTELQLLGSRRRPRLPLKLRPHMYVLCALCGLNNRSSTTAGAADRHLTDGHLRSVHGALLREAARRPPLQYACDECDAAPATRAQLAVHVLETGHQCAPSVCAVCDVEVDGERNAWRHRLWHQLQRPFQCYLCAEPFATEPECVAHVRAEHQLHYNVHMCARCPYSVSLVGQFIQHVQAHVGANTFVCHLCGVTFHTRASLRRHLQTHTSAHFPCPHCDSQFRHPLALERHVRSRHINPEDHTCKQCGKTYNSRYHLERHIKIHTNERLFQCDRCGKPFIQKCDLSRHARTCGPTERSTVGKAPPRRSVKKSPNRDVLIAVNSVIGDDN